jgi:type I restriction enzyme, R subunit
LTSKPCPSAWSNDRSRFAALGWQTLSAMEETFGTGGTLGGDTKSEVMPADRLLTQVARRMFDFCQPRSVATALDCR